VNIRYGWERWMHTSTSKICGRRLRGADIHLAKPITAETLFAAMNEAMERAVPDQLNAGYA
jgi:hypothetical protein